MSFAALLQRLVLMLKNKRNLIVQSLASLLMCMYLVIGFTQFVQAQDHETPNNVYELRTYHVHDGKMAALQNRFRDHTDAIFQRLGMPVIDYWTPTSEPEASSTLIYIIEHKSEEDAKQNWQRFSQDPQWIAAYQASIIDGPLVKSIDVVFMQTTDFSKKLNLKAE
jgi:hypothetical protein